jgi:hypothetical protein
MRRILLAALWLWCACGSGAMAQSRCHVMDPTGTPLNLRTAPNGQILGNLPNGVLVAVVDHAVDAKGKAWVNIKSLSDDATLSRVFREFIACS